MGRHLINFKLTADIAIRLILSDSTWQLKRHVTVHVHPRCEDLQLANCYQCKTGHGRWVQIVRSMRIDVPCLDILMTSGNSNCVVQYVCHTHLERSVLPSRVLFNTCNYLQPFHYVFICFVFYIVLKYLSLFRKSSPVLLGESQHKLDLNLQLPHNGSSLIHCATLAL